MWGHSRNGKRGGGVIGLFRDKPLRKFIGDGVGKIAVILCYVLFE